MAPKQVFDFSSGQDQQDSILDELDDDTPLSEVTAAAEPQGWDPGAEPEVVSLPDPDADITPEEEASLQSDLKLRLDIAKGYDIILTQEFFSGDTSPTAVRIQREIRGFVRQRMKTLLGVGGGDTGVPGSVGGGQFTAAEADTLRGLVSEAGVLLALAASLKKKATGAVAPPKFQGLSLNPAKPAAKPVPPRPPPPKPPAAAAAAAAAPRPATKPVPPRVVAAAARAQVDTDRIQPQYRNDPTLQTKDGQWFVQARNQDGLPQWGYNVKTKARDMLLKNVTIPLTNVAAGRPPIPMPSVAQSNMMAEYSAGAILEGVSNRMGARNTEMAVLGSIQRQAGDSNDGIDFGGSGY